MTAWHRLVHGATAPPTSGEMQTWEARRGPLIDQEGARRDAAGTVARTRARALGSRGTGVLAAGGDPPHHRAQRALRVAGRWRTRRQGTDHDTGARGVERIRSRRETCRRRRRPTGPVLGDAVTCACHGQHPEVSGISWV
jgi:hypothetical protein